MATEETEKVLPKGKVVLKNLVFQFTKYDSADIVERKTKFRLSARSGILGEDGVYREAIPALGEVGSITLEEAQTALVLADTVTLASGKELTGAEIAEGIGIMFDRIKNDDYKMVEVIEE